MNRDPDPHRDVQDDAIIAVAFRWSLLAVGLAAVVGAVLWWWLSRPAVPVAIEEAPPAAPERGAGEGPPPPTFRFTDVTAGAGLKKFEFVTGAYGERLLPETMVGGVALFDFDADRDPDILLTGGNYWPWDPDARALEQTAGLFVNDGGGAFTRRDATLGLRTAAYLMGAAVGDYDGDGWLDVYLTAVGHNALFRNLGGTGFADVTATAGVAGGAGDWTTGAAFFDADGDGWLDLLAVNYVAWTPELDRGVDYQLAGIGRAYGPPTNFPGTQPLYFRNRGDGTFEERAEAAGFWVENRGAPVAKALACYPRDLDGDGDLDVVVANDTTRNFVFLNDGGTFREAGEALGLAFDNTGKATGAMGLDGTRLYRDGTLGIAIGNFANEMTSFYTTAQTALLFADDAVLLGIGPASRQALTFGLFFADLDGDGREDLLQANGHIENEINRVQPSMSYAQAPQVFWNCGEDCPRPFVPVPAAALGDLGRPVVGRGASFADVDADGDLDVLIGQAGGGPRLYRNDTVSGHHWLRIALRDEPPNVFALGALVEIETSDGVQQRLVSPTRSYLSQSELTLTFGLGRAERVERIRVRWPDGTETDHPGVAADRLVEIRRR